MKRQLGGALVGLVVTVAASACAPDTIVLADIQALDDGGPPATRCLRNSDCNEAGLVGYCSYASCGASAGTCLPFPQESCPPYEQAVCGCDHVTYFNDCLRQSTGVSASWPGPCGLPGGPPAQRCRTASDCPDTAFCAHLGGGFGQGACPPPEANGGTCWGVPVTCPQSMVDHWNACGSGPDAGLKQCVDTCTAVQSGLSYEHASQDCQ